MSERDGMHGTAASDGGAPERVRERALAAQRLAEAAQRLAPADGTDAQRAVWQNAQVASIMAAEALDALPGDAELARAMADEAQSMAIEALKAAQVAAPAQPDAAQRTEPPAPAGTGPDPDPAQVAAPVQPPLEQAAPAAQPAAFEPASHTAWREAVPALASEAPQAQPDAAPESAAAKPAGPAQEPSPAPAAKDARADGAAGPSAAPAKRPHRLRNACIALAGVLLVMAGLLAGAWLGLFKLPEPVQERLYLLPDPHAQAGALNASDSGASPGGFQLVLNQLCTMDEGSLDCPIEFENPESNQYSARISLEADGRELARSGMVAPGAYLSTVQLDRALEPGDHEVRAVVRVYSGATQALTLSNSVTVRVG